MLSICRTCALLSPCKSVFEMDGEETLADKIFYCTQMKIHTSDEISKKICEKCIENLEISYSFKKKTEQSKRKLLEQLNEPIPLMMEVDLSDTLTLPNIVLETRGARKSIPKSKNTALTIKKIEEFRIDPSPIPKPRAKTVPKQIPAEYAKVKKELNEVKKILKQIEDSDVEGENSDEEYDILLQLQKSLLNTEAIIQTGSSLNQNISTISDLCDLNEDDFIFEEVSVTDCLEGFVNENIVLPSKKRYVWDPKTIKDRNEKKREYERKRRIRQTTGQCCGCNLSFPTFEELQKHSDEVHKCLIEILEVSDYKVQYCTICYQIFEGIAYRTQGHATETFRKRLKLINVPCCGCDMTFSSMDDLKEHSVIVHTATRETKFTEKRHECDICFRRYLTEKGLRKHKADGLVQTRQKIHNMRYRHVSSVRYNFEETTQKRCCGYKCTQFFDTEEELKEHSNMYHLSYKSPFENKDKPFECNICYRRFSFKNSMLHHQRIPYLLKNRICATCGEGFALSEHLLKHERTHTQVPTKCSICDKVLPSAESAQKHEVTIHSGITFICHLCGKVSTSKGSHENHMTRHETFKPFTCGVCNKKFKRRDLMNTHMRVHNGIKPFSCQFCKLRFAHFSDKKRHEMSHTGIYPYECKFCGKKFARRTHCEKHESTHEKL